MVSGMVALCCYVLVPQALILQCRVVFCPKNLQTRLDRFLVQSCNMVSHLPSVNMACRQRPDLKPNGSVQLPGWTLTPEGWEVRTRKSRVGRVWKGENCNLEDMLESPVGLALVGDRTSDGFEYIFFGRQI